MSDKIPWKLRIRLEEGYYFVDGFYDNLWIPMEAFIREKDAQEEFEKLKKKYEDQEEDKDFIIIRQEDIQ
jgi:hypothetical protein